MAEQGKWETISMEKAEEILEEFEAPTRKFMGIMGTISTALAVFCSLFALYGAFGSMITQVGRFMHVMLILMLTFLFYPPFRSQLRKKLRSYFFTATKPTARLGQDLQGNLDYVGIWLLAARTGTEQQLPSVEQRLRRTLKQLCRSGTRPLPEWGSA